MIAIDSFAYAEICARERARTEHTRRPRKILQDIFRITHHALPRLSRLWYSSREVNVEYVAIQPSNADVYAFMPVNRLMLYTYVNCTGCAVCKTNIRGFDWVSLVFLVRTIARANFIRDSVNLGNSLCAASRILC